MVILKPKITAKYFETRKKEQLTEKQKKLKLKNTLSGIQFLHIACQGKFGPLPSVSCATGNWTPDSRLVPIFQLCMFWEEIDYCSKAEVVFVVSWISHLKPLMFFTRPNCRALQLLANWHHLSIFENSSNDLKTKNKVAFFPCGSESGHLFLLSFSFVMTSPNQLIRFCVNGKKTKSKQVRGPMKRGMK